LRVSIRARDRLRQDSQVATGQPRTMDRARLTDGPLTRLTGEEMPAVERSFRAVTGLLQVCCARPRGTPTASCAAQRPPSCPFSSWRASNSWST
jgi:hypothetical protein